jgi:DHA1 family bicyclomycin/chloramphenicol resistance-like MFS transporter
MLRPQSPFYLLLLGMLSGISPFSTSIYMPSLPDIARSLGATPTEVQLTITTYLVGMAIGQVVHGPLSDRYGRKPVLVAALAAYSVCTLVCMLAWSIHILLAARAVQAISGVSGTVVSRAMIRDLYDGTAAARALSVLGAVVAVAPVLGPLLGGLMQQFFGWRAGFAVLTVTGVVLAVTLTFNLAETIKIRSQDPLSIAGTCRIFGSLLRKPAYTAYALLAATSFGGCYAWFSASSFALQEHYGLSALGFSMVFGINSVGVLVAAAIATRIVTRLGIDATIGIGASLHLIAGLAMLACLSFGPIALPLLVFLTTLFVFGLGFVMPQSYAGALLLVRQNAGAASSLAGAIQQIVGGLAAAMMGIFLGQSEWPVVVAVALMGGAVFVLWLTTRTLRASAPRE